jgi:hypothetical protein
MNDCIMSLSTLTSKELARIQKLIERKEALTGQIAEINSELESMDGSGSASPAPASAPTKTPASRKQAKVKLSVGRPRKAKAGKAGHGQLKERVTAELMSAGDEGLKVKDLAAKLGAKYSNVSAFFQTTGKKMKEIKKLGRGQYAWKGA